MIKKNNKRYFTSPSWGVPFRQKKKLAPPKKTEFNIDTWLLRISYFSQFGLLALTICGFYFTVIPLYQKAVLDELIAKKEIELKVMQTSLEKSYSLVRGYIVQQFVFSAGPECTGLLIPLKNPRRNSELMKEEHSTSDAVLELDSAACLRKIFLGATSLTQLRKNDYQYLSTQIEKIAGNLDERRKAALKEFQDLPEKVRKDPSMLKPVDGYSAAMIETLRPYISSQQYQKSMFDAALSQAQLEISSEYAAFARTEIFTLRTLKWGSNE